MTRWYRTLSRSGTLWAKVPFCHVFLRQTWGWIWQWRRLPAQGIPQRWPARFIWAVLCPYARGRPRDTSGRQYTRRSLGCLAFRIWPLLIGMSHGLSANFWSFSWWFWESSPGSVRLLQAWRQPCRSQLTVGSSLELCWGLSVHGSNLQV